MKPMNSSKLLTAACALSLAMGIAGGVHAKHEGVAHDKGGKKGPQLSIDVEVFCGDPTAKEYDMDGNEILDFGSNAAVRVTDVSDDNELEDLPQIDSVHIMCHTAVGKPTKNPPRVFSETFIENPENDFGDYTFQCDLDELPDGATEWKVTAVVTGEQLKRDVFDSCEEVEVLP